MKYLDEVKCDDLKKLKEEIHCMVVRVDEIQKLFPESPVVFFRSAEALIKIEVFLEGKIKSELYRKYLEASQNAV